MRPEDEIRPEDRSNVANVSAALRALSEADRGLEAAPEVEARLRAAFRQRSAHKRSKRIWPAVWAIAAMAILGIAVGYYHGLRVEPDQVAHNAPAVTPGVASEAAAPVVQAPVDQKPRVMQARNTTPNRQPNAQIREIATDFFPLVDFAPPVESGELMRVSLPASAMREVGLPVREDRMSDRVQADVVMSNGLATAIRFVRNSE